MSRLLITGSAGFLGQNLVRELSRDHEVHATYFKTPPEEQGSRAVPMDVTDPSSVSRVFRDVRPHLVVHAAAHSHPDRCEQDPAGALEVNVTGTTSVGEAARKHGARFVHISTDLVFDGSSGFYREEDPVRGLNVYARSKIAAERAALEANPASLILRTSLIYGRGSAAHPGFLETVLDRWREGKPIRFYRDQYRTPVAAFWIAAVVGRLLDLPTVRGVFHVAGADRLSRLEFGRLLAEVTGADPGLAEEGSANDGGTGVPRGADCSLVCEKLESATGLRALRCRDGLDVLVARGDLPRMDTATGRAS